MKKTLLTSAFMIATILFNGCGANQGVGMGDYRDSVKYQFIEGKVIDSQKVLVSKEKVALVTGMAIGASTGALIGASSTGGVGVVKGTIIGGTMGAVGGLTTGYIMDNNEEEAYQITVRKGLDEYTAFIKQDIPLNTRLEFVVREDKSVTNLTIKKD